MENPAISKTAFKARTRTLCQRMIFRLVLSLLIALLIFFFQVAEATEFVVNQHAVAASDDNPGSREKPFKTISAAASKVKSGDKVIVHGGDYRETVIINASGTTESPIIFEAAPGEKPVIKGSDIVTGWQRDQGSVWKAGLAPLNEHSEDSKDPSYCRTNDVRIVFIRDGVLLDGIGLRRVDLKEELRPGTFFYSTKDGVLFVQMTDSLDPNSVTMEATRRSSWMQVFGSHITLRGIQMRHCANSGASTGPGCFLRGDDILLQDCDITWSDYVGVLLAGKGDKLIRCTIACHGNSAIGGTGEEQVIERCRVLYNNLNRFDPGWHCGGAKLIPNFSRSRITHNEFAYNVGPGLWLDGNCNDNLIEGNLCHDNEGPGIMIEASARNRIFNNICFGNRNFLAADFLSPEGDSGKGGSSPKFRKVRRGKELLSQLIYHAGDGRGIYISSSPESKVYHNTCYLNEGEGICVEGPLRADGGDVPMSTHDCEVLNNISVYNKGTQLVIRGNANDKETYRNKSDYNVLLSLGAVFAQLGWNSPFVLSLKEWQRTGYDQHSIQDDPAFAMGAMSDFRLLPLSPALHAAPPLDEVRRDFMENPRGTDKVSLGACENPAFDYPRPAAQYLFIDPDLAPK